MTMPIRSALRLAATLLLAIPILVGTASPAAAVFGSISGFVTDFNTGAPIPHTCVWLGPVHLDTNCTFTDGTGFYHIDNLPPGLTWPLTFHHPPDYTDFTVDSVPINGAETLSVKLHPTGVPGTGGPTDACVPASTAAATTTLYLPNITKTLGGAGSA